MAKAFVIPSIFTAVDKFSGPVKKMGRNAESSMARMERKMRRVSAAAFDVSRKSALIGLAVIGPLAIMTQKAIKFEDKLADIGKTTGLADGALQKLGNEIINISKTTRSSIEDIATIGEIGGQLGIAEQDLLGFIVAADKFNIALGADFGGGVEEAVSQVGKIKNLFASTRDINIAESINKTGSAINELGAKGSGTSANITDFTLRLGALPDALKPSITDTLALGTFLEEVGINAQIGASGLSNLLVRAGRNVGDFAAQMDISTDAAKDMLAKDPTSFVKKLSASLQGLAPDELANKLQDLQINSLEVTKVIGALGSGTERLTKLQLISSKAFEEGNSLQIEAAKKNETSAAKIAIMKNRMEGLAITLGNALIPVLSSVMEVITPLIDQFTNWAQNNKGTVDTVLKLAAGFGGIALAISAVSFVVGIFSKAMLIAKVFTGAYNIVLGLTGAISNTASIAIGKSSIALKAYSIGTKIVTAAQWLWNAALMANPIVLIIIAVAALAAGIIILATATAKQTQAERLNGEVRKRALENSIEQRVEVTMLFQALRKAEVGSTKYNDTLKELERIQPGIVKNFNLQAGALKDINAAEKELIGNILKKAETEARAELIKEKFTAAQKLRDEGPGFIEKAQALVFGSGLLGTDLQKISSAQGIIDTQIKNLESDAVVLAEQQAAQELGEETVNPKLTQQEVINSTMEKTTKEKVLIEFKNEPEGMTVSGGGTGNISLPGMTSTRN